MKSQVVIFSDLDGCLLNKSDYRFEAALPTLSRIRKWNIPLVLASSKTETEMRGLAHEMQLADAPLICENGGVLFWSRDTARCGPENSVVLGAKREHILTVLKELKADFDFESFEDMQVDGVSRATDLPLERAAAALQRSSTEPLLWRDAEERLRDFQKALAEVSLTLTRGGRFWHVAGPTDKGRAMQYVLDHWPVLIPGPVVSLAIGDSPIDQGMLDIADYPIAIPAPDGVVHVRVSGQNSRISKTAGAAGWADTVSEVLDALL